MVELESSQMRCSRPGPAADLSFCNWTPTCIICIEEGSLSVVVARLIGPLVVVGHWRVAPYGGTLPGSANRQCATITHIASCLTKGFFQLYYFLLIISAIA